MGSNEDIMHEFVKKELKRLYPSVDGWQIKPVQTGGKEQGFTVSRRLLGRSEGAYVLVSFDRKIAPGTVDTLMAMGRLEQIGGVAAPRKILVVPQGSDVSAVPKEASVLFMQSFGFEDKELVWLKRRAQMSEKASSKETA